MALDTANTPPTLQVPDAFAIKPPDSKILFCSLAYIKNRKLKFIN